MKLNFVYICNQKCWKSATSWSGDTLAESVWRKLCRYWFHWIVSEFLSTSTLFIQTFFWNFKVWFFSEMEIAKRTKIQQHLKSENERQQNFERRIPKRFWKYYAEFRSVKSVAQKTKCGKSSELWTLQNLRRKLKIEKFCAEKRNAEKLPNFERNKTFTENWNLKNISQKTKRKRIL